MDENEKLPDLTVDENEVIPEFTLEDILAEFGSGAHPQPEPAEESPAQAAPPEEEDDCKIYTPGEVSEPAPAPVSGDTVRIDTAAIASQIPADVTGDTIRLDTAAIAEKTARQAVESGDTVRFTPISQQSPVTHAPEDTGAEPFSENWEPVYDAPIADYDPNAPTGEYVPPEPIVFRPKSRLQELKRKLMDGPEKRYNALMEQGVTRLQVAIFFSLLVVILAVVSIVMDHMGLVRENRMRLLVFGEMFAMLVSALLAANLISDGFADLMHGHFTLNSLLSVTFIACILDAAFCLREVRVPFCAAFCLEVAMALWAEYQRRTTEASQMDTLRRATRLNRVEKAPDCFEGRPGLRVTDGEVEDFMDAYTETPAPTKTLNFYSLLATVASLIIGIYAAITNGLASGIQIWSAAMLAAAPVTIFISQTRPAAILERRLSRFGALICGWKGISAMSGQSVVPLRDTDLFPAGSVKINGVKFYSGRNADHIISCAAALMDVSGNGLAPLFDQLADSRGSHRCVVDESRIYGTNGVGGIIEGESVLMGTKAFLRDMGVEIPEGAHVSQAVYLSIEGEFCAVFALAYGKLKGVSASLHALSSYTGLTPVLASDNFLLSEEFIRAKFSVNTNRFAFPTPEVRRSLAAWQPEEGTTVPCALTTQDGLTGTAFAITGARNLRSSMNWGTIIHIFGGIVGLVCVLALTAVGAWHLLTPTNLLVFELIWTVPGMLISSWTRRL